MRNWRAFLFVPFAACCLAAPARAEDSPALQRATQELKSADKQTRRDVPGKVSQLKGEAPAAVQLLIKALGDPDRQVSMNAIEALGDLGPLAADAIPSLVALLDSKKARGGKSPTLDQTAIRIALALGRIGPAAIPHLATALTSADLRVSQGAARALGAMGSGAAEVVPGLVQALASPSAELRAEAVDALVSIGASSLAPLQASLSSENPKVRESSARALGGLGQAAEATTAALSLVAEKDADSAVRAAAIAALVRTATDSSACMPSLVQGLRSSDEVVVHAAVNAFTQMHPISLSVSQLQLLLTDDEITLRPKAARALGRIGSRAKAAAPALAAAAKAAPTEPVFAAALGQLGPDILPLLQQELQAALADPNGHQEWIFKAFHEVGAPAAPMLAEQLRSTSSGSRALAIGALAEMLRRFPEITKSVVALASDPEADVRAGALSALAPIRAQRDTSVKLLEAALEDPAPQVQKAAAFGLAEMGVLRKINAEGLIVLLGQAGQQSDLALVRALGDLGPKSAAAVPKLIPFLEVRPMRATTVEALGKIGPAAAAAVPQIAEYLRGRDRDLRIASLLALGGIGEPKEVVIPLLQEAMKTMDLEGRAAGYQAMVLAERDPEKIIPILVGALNDGASRVRIVAAEALAPFGEKAVAAGPGLVAMLDKEPELAIGLTTLRAIHVRDVPLLIATLNTVEPNTRIYACNALRDLGAAAKEALPALDREAGDDHPDVKSAAQDAVKKIRDAIAASVPVPESPSAAPAPTP